MTFGWKFASKKQRYNNAYLATEKRHKEILEERLFSSAHIFCLRIVTIQRPYSNKTIVLKWSEVQ